MSRKITAGRCGVCGRAVEILDVVPPISREGVFWLGGHCYSWDYQARAWCLDSVRCDDHAKDPTDPRTNLIQPGCI